MFSLLKNFNNNIRKINISGLVGLMFNNTSYKQTIAKNTIWLIFAHVIIGLVNLFITVYVIRLFGPTEYGKFAFAFSFAMLFSTFFDLGLSVTITREFAGDRNKERHFSNILGLKATIGLIAICSIIISSFFITKDLVIRNLIIVLGFYVFILEVVNLFYALFRARQRIEIEALIKLANSFLLLIMVMLVINLSGAIFYLGLAYLFSILLIAAAVFIILIFWQKMRNLIGISFDRRIWKEFFVIGWYIALSRGVTDLTMNTDSVMLGYWGQIKENGWYSAASKIISLSLFPMVLISTAIFPALVAMHKESRTRFIKYWDVWVKGTVYFAVFMCFLTLATADKIIVTVFSSSFSSAALALKILIFMSAAVTLYSTYYYLLLIFNQQKRIFFVLLSAALINVTLNYLLIPTFSLYGASVASAISHFIILFLFIVLTYRHTFIKPVTLSFVSDFIASALSGVLMYMALSSRFISGFNLPVSIILGTFLYSISLFIIIRVFRIGQAKPETE